MSKLSNIVEIKNGKASSKNGGLFPIYGGNGIIGYTDQYNYENVVVIGRVGANCGSVHLALGKCWVSDNALAALPLNGNTKFNYYLLNSLNLNKRQIGSSQPLLTQGILNNLEIKFPEMEFAQKSIGRILSSLDSKIEVNNKINAELEAMTKTIYDYWFVQFDFPISKEQAKAMGNAKLEGKPYKSSGGKMVWSEELKREIPEGWNVQMLFNLTDIVSRGISPKYLDTEGVCVLNQKCIRDNSIKFNFSRRHDNKFRDASPRRIKLYDVLVNSTGVGTLGRVAMVKRLPEDFITVDSHVTIVRPNPRLINGLYFGFTVTQKQREIEGFSLGSTGQVELSRSQLESINIIVPPEDIQKKFASFYSPTFEKIAACEIENQQLDELRDWLLPMLMNGQVKVEDVSSSSRATETKVVKSGVLRTDEENLGKVAEKSIVYGKSNIKKLSIPENKKSFAKQVLAGKIISLFREDKHFTDIKFQKLQYLAEHIAEADLNWNYYQKMAGPYDNKFMHIVFTNQKNNKWFDNRANNFKPLAKVNDINTYYEKYFGAVETKLNKLFTLLKPAPEAQSEVIATVYAIWNNLIIKNENMSDKNITKLFFEWSDRKKGYTEKQVVDTIKWMKEKGIEPTGFGKVIKELRK